MWSWRQSAFPGKERGLLLWTSSMWFACHSEEDGSYRGPRQMGWSSSVCDLLLNAQLQIPLISRHISRHFQTFLYFSHLLPLLLLTPTQIRWSSTTWNWCMDRSHGNGLSSCWFFLQSPYASLWLMCWHVLTTSDYCLCIYQVAYLLGMELGEARPDCISCVHILCRHWTMREGAGRQTHMRYDSSWCNMHKTRRMFHKYQSTSIS